MLRTVVPVIFKVTERPSVLQELGLQRCVGGHIKETP